MSKLPTVTGRQMLNALQRGGFFVVRTRGSHYRLASREDLSRRMTVPVHKGQTLKRGVVESILEQANWTVEDLLKFL